MPCTTDERHCGVWYTMSDHNCRINFIITYDKSKPEELYFVKVVNTTTKQVGGFIYPITLGRGQSFVREAVHKYLKTATALVKGA